MKRYKFRLERLLQLRRYVERRWEMKLAEITGECVRLEKHIRGLQREKDSYAGFAEGGAAYSVNEILVRETFRSRIDLEMEKASGELESARKKREEVNASYLAASRARKILDKLKERKAEEYYGELRREEAKIMNETAMFQAAGRKGGE
jgi:flagellar FliJ protein